MQNSEVKTARGWNWIWAAEKFVVAKRVISASARVINLLEVLWSRQVCKVKVYKCRLAMPVGLQRRLIQGEQ